MPSAPLSSELVSEIAEAAPAHSGGTAVMIISLPMVNSGHQGIQGAALGVSKLVDGKLTLSDVRRYSAEAVNPPAGAKSEDWIKTGLPRH